MNENEIEYAKTVLIDQETGEEITSPYVIRDVQITKKMRIPLYESGKLKSDEILQNLGLIVKHYTQEELDKEKFDAYYQKNPTLAERVRQYARLLGKYDLAIDSTSDQISASIMSDENLTESEKISLGASLLTLIHDIELNYAEVGGDGFSAWSDLPKLIQYLPVESESSESENN